MTPQMELQPFFFPSFSYNTLYPALTFTSGLFFREPPLNTYSGDES